MRKTSSRFPSQFLHLAMHTAIALGAVMMSVNLSAQEARPAAPTNQGGGTAGTIPVWINAKSQGNSVITQSSDNPPNVLIGTTQDAAKLTVDGGPNATGVFGHTSGASGFSGVMGVSDGATPNGSVGVSGVCSSTDGVCNGVSGFSSAPNGIAIVGYHMASSGDAAAVAGFAYNTTGEAAGIYAESHSPQSYAAAAFGKGAAGAAFLDGGGGNIILGVTNLVAEFRVDAAGKGYFNGGTQVGGADFAESVAVTGDQGGYRAGDVLIINPASEKRVALSDKPYSALVAGIYSTKPGVLASTSDIGEHATSEVPLAIVGIVPCNVSAENGAISPGDLLVTSSTIGHAMKGTDRKRMLGAVIGKALEPLPKGKGVIQVLVTLQ